MKPKRHPSGVRHGTFLVTSSTYGRKVLLSNQHWARLFIEVLYEQRRQGRLSLHAWCVMPDHFHLLITVGADVGLERAVQFVKGGFSFRVGKEFGSRAEVWQRGFDDQWIREEEAFVDARRYVLENPVRARLAVAADKYPFCSAFPGFEADPAPSFAG